MDKAVRAGQWRVCYQRGLPCLVFYYESQKTPNLIGPSSEMPKKIQGTLFGGKTPPPS